MATLPLESYHNQTHQFVKVHSESPVLSVVPTLNLRMKRKQLKRVTWKTQEACQLVLPICLPAFQETIALSCLTRKWNQTTMQHRRIIISCRKGTILFLFLWQLIQSSNLQKEVNLFLLVQLLFFHYFICIFSVRIIKGNLQYMPISCQQLCLLKQIPCALTDHLNCVENTNTFILNNKLMEQQLVKS